MSCTSHSHKHILLYLIGILAVSYAVHTQKYDDDIKVLNVGEELYQEILPLQMGYRIYELHRLKPSTWYEVKISYPASIPASFSIHEWQENWKRDLNQGRRLLNTEKLIFKAGSPRDKRILVSVKPEGIVALPFTREREYVTFNIVCDELSFGIPHKAWWVGALAVLCVGIAFFIPKYLLSYFFPKQNLPSSEFTFKSS
ncbi:hypothetical protein H6P81_007583 [Aristolochia fimbriata]|uniref:Uncharacterized protein n=1 Tax=Aristolochia fimbriata TaxID=158543 RepID=A0AAV7F1B2_ARIFI|nr:hypothetical protein H6P81_007583 [Aristolochia fimbriata]